MADRAKDFFTETASMRTLTFPSSDQVDWGFRVGVSLVALFAITEISALGYHFVGARMARRAAAPAVVASATTPAPAAPSTAASAAPLTTAAPVAPSTAPAPSTATVSPADRLLQEARTLRERGDTTTALARLQEASQRDPKNAQVLGEMAATYESMQLYDRSNETWRKIESIGPSAGSLYELAQTKLKVGAAAPAVANAAPAVTPLTMAAAAPATEQSTSSSRLNLDGSTDGAVLTIGDISVTEAPDNDAETNLTVRIPIKAKTGTIIDHTKVTIRVYFYDTIGEDPKPLLTDAQTNFEWLTPNHDWATPNPEVLAVSYYRPKNQAVSSEAALSAAAAAVVPGKKARTSTKPAASGNRHYLGYIVRIYYNDKLQAERAQPSQLLAIFPSPSSP
ncbi:MAG: tetratricopeptide repeat protein [Chthoniobacterales bacterium]